MSFLKNNKMIYGSAGFGMPAYGFSSKNKPTSDDYLNDIYDLGIRHIDTASSYGSAEKKIGEYHRKNKNRFNIWTKVDGLSCNSHYTIDKIFKSLKSSIEKTNVEFFECLYLHQNNIEIIEDKFVQKGLEAVKNHGFANNTGVSIYNDYELKSALSIDVFNVVQLPVSVVNTHLYKIAQKSVYKKVLVARSIFLQGVLLNVESFNKKFNYYDEIHSVVNFLKELAHDHNLDYLTMLVAYVNSLKDLDYIIVSSKNIQNINNIIQKSTYKLCESIISTINEISYKENNWTNPRNWIV